MAAEAQTPAVPLPGALPDEGDRLTQEAEAVLSEHLVEQEMEKLKKAQVLARTVERQRKRAGTTQLEEEAAKTAVKEGAASYTGEMKVENSGEAAARLLAQGTPASSSAEAETKAIQEARAEALRRLTQISAGKDEDLDMSDGGEFAADEPLKALREEQEYERVKRRQIERRLDTIERHTENPETTQGLAYNIACLKHGITKIFEILDRDETMYEQSTLVIKKKGLSMKDFYAFRDKWEDHLQSADGRKLNELVALTLASGPAITVIGKFSSASKKVTDAVKSYADEARVGKDVAVFRGKKQIQKLREQPLEQVRNELGDRFGVADAKGLKRLQGLVMHWPTAQSGGCWALSVTNSVIAWSEQGSESFVTKIFLNEEHGLFKGPTGTNMSSDGWNGLLIALEGRIAENSLLPAELGKAPITVRTPVQGRGLKGAGKGAR